MIFGKTPALLSVGSKAPDFEVLDQLGRTVTLAEQRGHHVLLWFYPRAATPG